MARKRTKKEARKRIRDLPDVPFLPVLGKTPVGRAAKSSSKTARFLAERLVAKDPLDRLEGDGYDIFGTRYLRELNRRMATKNTPLPPTPGPGMKMRSDSIPGPTKIRKNQKQKKTGEKKMADADEIIDAFLEGLQEGMTRRFGSVAEPDNLVRGLTRRAVGGRARSADPFGLLELQALLAELEEEQKIEPKKKRKRSKYNKELSRQLAKLRKEKPRTKQTALMKEAHKRTRKKLGMKKRRK